MKRQKTVADYVAAFVIGAVVGVFIAWGLMTQEGVESKEILIGTIVGSGFLAAFGWDLFWWVAGAFLKIES